LKEYDEVFFKSTPEWKKIVRFPYNEHSPHVNALLAKIKLIQELYEQNLNKPYNEIEFAKFIYF